LTTHNSLINLINQNKDKVDLDVNINKTIIKKNNELEPIQKKNLRAFDSIKLVKSKELLLKNKERKASSISNKTRNDNLFKNKDKVSKTPTTPISSVLKKKDEIIDSRKTKTVRFTDDIEIVHLYEGKQEHNEVEDTPNNNTITNTSDIDLTSSNIYENKFDEVKNPIDCVDNDFVNLSFNKIDFNNLDERSSLDTSDKSSKLTPEHNNNNNNNYNYSTNDTDFNKRMTGISGHNLNSVLKDT